MPLIHIIDAMTWAAPIKPCSGMRHTHPNAVTKSTTPLAQVFQLALPSAESKFPKGMRSK
tara:strand:+ start:688 stop:867 length:180 start_codon:yes stop_codon:yes gene_type:complete